MVSIQIPNSLRNVQHVITQVLFRARRVKHRDIFEIHDPVTSFTVQIASDTKSFVAQHVVGNATCASDPDSVEECAVLYLN